MKAVQNNGEDIASLNERLFEPRTVPNFLIVGAARSGTTSLWHWLRQHPQVYMPRYKEPAFFVHNFGVFTQDEYLSLFKPGRGRPCIGEASTAYLSAPESPPWIHELLGKVKIVAILRNPVERAYSMYCWMAMIGLEPLETFEEAIEQESRRMGSLPFQQNCLIASHNYQYFNAGLYVDRIGPYISIFGADRVKLLLFDDLKSDPSGFCADVCEFLEISNANGHAFRSENGAVIPRSTPLQFRLRAMRARTRKLMGMSHLSVTSWYIMAMLINKARGAKKPMSPAIRAELVERYRTSVEQLSDLLHRDLSHWLK